MKPSDKQLESVRHLITQAHEEKGMSNAEIGRIARVHSSQVSRICSGNFKTLSHNVEQVCKVLDVRIAGLEPKIGEMDSVWAQAQSSMRRIWDETPEGAMAITRILDAIGELKTKR